MCWDIIYQHPCGNISPAGIDLCDDAKQAQDLHNSVDREHRYLPPRDGRKRCTTRSCRTCWPALCDNPAWLEAGVAPWLAKERATAADAAQHEADFQVVPSMICAVLDNEDDFFLRRCPPEPAPSNEAGVLAESSRSEEVSLSLDALQRDPTPGAPPEVEQDAGERSPLPGGAIGSEMTTKGCIKTRVPPQPRTMANSLDLLMDIWKRNPPSPEILVQFT